ENPSFLTVNRKKEHLYAISEVDNGEVVCFGIDHQERKIHEINRHFTKGGPCYVELGANEDYIFTANYGGGSIVVHALNENGEIEKETDFLTYQSKKKCVRSIKRAYDYKYIQDPILYSDRSWIKQVICISL